MENKRLLYYTEYKHAERDGHNGYAKIMKEKYRQLVKNRNIKL